MLMLWLPPLAVPNSMDAIELPLKDDPKFNAVHGPEDDGSHDVNALLNPNDPAASLTLLICILSKLPPNFKVCLEKFFVKFI